MKVSKLTYLLVIALALTVASTGCRKRPTNVTNIPGGASVPKGPGPAGIDGTGITATPGQGPVGRPGGDDVTPQSDKWNNATEDRASLAAHTVYFDFDSSVIKSSERSNLEAAAAYLKANPNMGLRIEGNCDERGTEEYNRSLGERRALAARDLIFASGVETDRVVTVSFGKDKPADPGHDDKAWAKNRRDEFVVLIPK